MNESRVMAIDFGLQRVGIALSDPLRIIASPFTVLKNDPQLVENIQKIVIDKSVTEIILGYPLKEDGSITTVTKAVEDFRKLLEKHLKISVTLIDERYSSSIASERIKSTVTKKMKRRDKGLIDMNAAAVILEDYLNKV
ncbi:MAG: Holliday junction resolvase RuvX [Ignavibacteria bacterium]|nr:Holliday junction resolvase RuvX [Ignavibacteria bacterium]